MATDAEAAAAGFSTPVGTNLISGGDNAIRQNARVTLDLTREAAFAKPTTLPGGDLNALTKPGAYPFWAGVANTPSDLSGTVYVTQLHTTAGAVAQTVQLAFSPSTAGSRLDMRFTGSAGWSAWERLDSGAIDLTEFAGPAGGASPVTFKTVPLALTVGGGRSTSTAAGAVRLPMRFGVRVPRWRVHIANINPRFGTHGPSAQIDFVYFGTKGTTPGTATNLRALGGSAQVSDQADGSSTEYVTKWTSVPIEADTDYVLSFGHVGAGAREMNVGGGWTSPTRADAISDGGGTWTAASSVPFDVWIEAEVAPVVPVVAAFGDSLSSGVGATLPVHDSWLSQWCRTHGALPVHYAASGDTMAGWADSDAYKWTRWQNLSRPDCVIHAMGSNDVFGGATLATMKERRAASMDQLRAFVSPVIYSATILPRNGAAGVLEDTRRAYNTYVLSLPDAARDAFDFVPAVSADDENIAPGVNADGIHLTTVGYRDVSETITRPLTSSALPDALARLEVLEYDSGRRSLALPAGVEGTLVLRRAGTTVEVNADAIRGVTGTITFPDVLPAEFRPISTISTDGAGAALRIGYTGQITLEGVTSVTAWHYRHLTFTPTSLAKPATPPGSSF